MDAVLPRQVLARRGEFHWSTPRFRYAGRFEALADGPWRRGLVDFLAEFAVQRGGRSRPLPSVAVIANELNAGEVP